MDGELDQTPTPGKDLTLGLDIKLQMLGERLMQNKIGVLLPLSRRQEKFFVWFRPRRLILV